MRRAIRPKTIRGSRPNRKNFIVGFRGGAIL